MQVKAKHIDTAMATDQEVAQAIDALVGRTSCHIISKGAAESSTYTAIGNRYMWLSARNSTYFNGVFIAYINTSGATRFIEIRLVNLSTGTEVFYHKVNTTDPSGFITYAIPNPDQDCLLELQIRKETSNGIGATIEVATIEFDTL